MSSNRHNPTISRWSPAPANETLHDKLRELHDLVSKAINDLQSFLKEEQPSKSFSIEKARNSINQVQLIVQKAVGDLHDLLHSGRSIAPHVRGRLNAVQIFLSDSSKFLNDAAMAVDDLEVLTQKELDAASGNILHQNTGEDLSLENSIQQDSEVSLEDGGQQDDADEDIPPETRHQGLVRALAEELSSVRLEGRSLESVLMEEFLDAQAGEGGVLAALEEQFQFAPLKGGVLETALKIERQLESEMGSQEPPVEDERV